MTQHALYVELEAKPGKEQEVATFLSSARSMVDQEPDTTAWFAIRMGPTTFGIFDAFRQRARPGGPSSGQARDRAHVEGPATVRPRRRRSIGWTCSPTSCPTRANLWRAPSARRR